VDYKSDLKDHLNVIIKTCYELISIIGKVIKPFFDIFIRIIFLTRWNVTIILAFIKKILVRI
jgi:hypothetical protein